MRIPWFICLLLMLGTVGITWHLRTKEMNFFPDESIEEPSRVQDQSYEFIGPPAPLQLSSSDLNEESALPGLDHFSEHLETPDKLSRLFSVLKAEQNFELAYLAGERMLESTKLTDDDKRDSCKQMIPLISVIKPYVFDVSESRELELTLVGIAAESQKAITDKLDELVYQSSGGLASLVIKFTAGEPALTLSIGKSDSFTPLPENPDLPEIISRLYILLVSEMNKNSAALPLWQGATAEEFTVTLTRNSWTQLLPEPEPEEKAEKTEE